MPASCDLTAELEEELEVCRLELGIYRDGLSTPPARPKLSLPTLSPPLCTCKGAGQPAPPCVVHWVKTRPSVKARLPISLQAAEMDASMDRRDSPGTSRIRSVVLAWLGDAREMTPYERDAIIDWLERERGPTPRSPKVEEHPGGRRGVERHCGHSSWRRTFRKLVAKFVVRFPGRRWLRRGKVPSQYFFDECASSGQGITPQAVRATAGRACLSENSDESRTIKALSSETSTPTQVQKTLWSETTTPTHSADNGTCPTLHSQPQTSESEATRRYCKILRRGSWVWENGPDSLDDKASLLLSSVGKHEHSNCERMPNPCGIPDSELWTEYSAGAQSDCYIHSNLDLSQVIVRSFWA